MKIIAKGTLAMAGVLVLGLTALKAQTDSALLDALVKKGVLSGQEAENIRAKAAKEYAQTPAGKLSISDSVQKLTIYGDVRYRFEYADEKATATTAVGGAGGAALSGDNITERNRYRLRVGADYVFTDNFKAGIQLESNAANDSANQTFGNAYGKSGINIGLIYLQWKPADWVTLTGGKQRNPLYTTDLQWDPDINPEGASEALSFTFPLGEESAPVARDPKDMKAAVTPKASGESLTVGFTALQGIYADNNEFNASIATQNKTDVWQFVEQVPVQYNFDKSTFVKVVPGFTTYTGGGNLGPGGVTPENGGGTQSFSAYNAADHLALFTAPGEFDWKWGKVPMKFYWDFVDNLDGKQRVQDVYLSFPAGTAPTASGAAAQNQNRALGDNIAWLAGISAGQNKKKGDWSAKLDYRQVGLGSIDPNENDSDWGDSFLNQQGIKFSSTYNFTDFLTGTISIYDTWAYKSNIFAAQNVSALQVANTANVTNPTAGIQGLAAASQTQRVDVDLQWKF